MPCARSAIARSRSAATASASWSRRGCASTPERARIDPDDVWSSRTHWAAGVLDQARLDWMARPPAARLGRGRRARRRALLPRLAAQRRGDRDAALARGAHRSDARRRDADARSCSATRTCSSTARWRGRRLVNAGSVGLPYEGRGGRVLGAARPRRRVAQHALRRDGDLRPRAARAASPTPRSTPRARAPAAAPPRRASSSSAWPRAAAPESASDPRHVVPDPAGFRRRTRRRPRSRGGA